MNIKFCLWLVLLSLLMQSCTLLRQSPKYSFTEGYYKSRLFGEGHTKVYVVPTEDSIKVYNAKSLQQEKMDTVRLLTISFPPVQKPLNFEAYRFRQNSFDVDVLTILFKYRPSSNGFPQQFNTTFNGAVYFGYRSDIYKLSYRQTPLQVYKRHTSHYGYSFGGFTGIGTSRIDEYVTNSAINIQYDGAVWTNGLAAIIGVNNLSVGLTAGIDHLLDRNGKFWVNQHKPWVGISFGLNLN